VKLTKLVLLAFVLPVACGGDPEPQAEAPAPAATPEPQRAAQAQPAPAAEPRRIELAQADTATLESDRWKAGTHYQRLSPTQPTSTGPDQVEVAEFFMYSCVHCYNFEPYVEDWLEAKPAYINFIRVPTVWNPLVRLHAQAFYAAEALNKGEEMHQPFFREIHVNGNYLDNEATIAEFVGEFGVPENEFKAAFDSFAVHAKLQRADELTRRYRVSSTPSVVVNGKYVTNATMAGGYPALLELINDLAASERSRN
jgi:protein dithiol oxidoreductase (disulfide-forming)